LRNLKRAQRFDLGITWHSAMQPFAIYVIKGHC
jgi:hypothetical protein